MTMVISGGNQHKAERIARDIVKDLTVMDIEFTIAEGMGLASEQRLCSAIDEDFLKCEKRLSELQRQIDHDSPMDEFDNLRLKVSAVRQQASFALGYAAALRLFGTASPARPAKQSKKGKRR